jgi:3-oxoacyl-[acyl-carrier protein] reductase
VDILIANASGLYGHDVPLLSFDQFAWPDIERIVLRRITSLVYPLQSFLPGMVERKRGSVVVVGSSLSRVPAANMFPISMAQAAVDAGIKALAREVGPHGVRINGVAPNFILTASTSWAPEAFKTMVAERSAVRRNGLPGDVAELIAFLASDRASYLTGSYVVADGGTAML